MRSLFVLTIGLLLSILCHSQSLKKVNWIEDIDFLARELPEKHYDFFTVKSKKEFLEGLDRIKLNSATLTDLEIAIKLQQLVASFGDSHTNVNYSKFIEKDKILPLHTYWFSDGLFILHTTQENTEILCHQILSLNGVPLQTITDSLATLLTKDNQAINKNFIPKLFPLVQILEYYGFVKAGEITLELKAPNGVKKTYALKPAEMTRQNRKMYKPDSLALCFKNERAFFIDYYQAEDNIYYLQYNRCWSKELELKYGNAKNAEGMPSFEDFEEKVFQTLANNAIDKVVIDLRFNSGGNSAQGTQLAEKLAKYLEKNTNTKVYVILGRSTFSSAILNAMDLKRLTNAVFVGEETSGKPNHFGEVKNFQLPTSGIKINYSTKYFKRTPKNVNTIAPDIQQETSFANFSSGTDPAYEWIKSH